MSNVNEPEGALKLAAAMVRDQIRTGRTMRDRMQQMADLLGRTVALADLLDAANGEVVMVDSEDGSTTLVADQVEGLRGLLLSFHEMDAAFDEQLDGAEMLYDRFLKRYTDEDDDAGHA